MEQAGQIISLVAAIGLGVIGVMSLVLPSIGAKLTGLPEPEKAGATWARAKGFRDLVLAAIVAVLVLRAEAATIGAVVLLISLVPLVDGGTMLLLKRVPWVWLHLGLFVALVLGGGLLLLV